VKGTPEFDDTLDRMIGAARRFDAKSVKVDQVARTGGAPAEE